MQRTEFAPIAMNSTLLGRTMSMTRSVYLKTSTIMSSSVSGAGCWVIDEVLNESLLDESCSPDPLDACKDAPSRVVNRIIQ